MCLPIVARRSVIAIVCLALVAACGSDSATAPAADDAARAVAVFARLADSVARSGGDNSISGAYASLAEAVRVGGRISPLVITLDGVATSFLATAQQMEIAVTPCASPLCLAAARLTTLRTLIAWQQDDPRRVVQLSSEADGDPIRAYLFPMLVPFPGPSASLIFFDGKGGTYFGASGSQKFGVSTGNVPCVSSGPNLPFPAIPAAPARCTQASFSVTFDARAEPSSFLADRNVATGSHTFSMPTQSVLGSRFELTAAVPPLPPIVVTPSVLLPSALSAKVDSLVTLTLTVSNPSSAPAQVAFNSGQHSDFTISDAATGALLWRSGAGAIFIQMLTTQTIPANGTVVYTAQWKPTEKGTLFASGSLVSQSHRAEAKLVISVP